MSNNVVPLRSGQMPAAFAGRNLPDMGRAMTENVQAGFAVVGYKGRTWRIKHGGADTVIMGDNRQPIGSLEVVIVGVSPNISKNFYEKRYAEGDAESPDCWSVNGRTPDPASPKLQCETCAACPQNVFGSRVTEAGKKAKACQDYRRIAVVPKGDPNNETYGGPMMLRIPPMSLANLARYGQELTRYGAQPYAVGTRLSFDYDVAYPLITLEATGWLDDETAVEVAPILDDPQIERMLEQAPPEGPDSEAPPAQASALAGGKPSQALAKPAPAQQVQAQPAAQAQPQAEQAPVEQVAAASPTASPSSVTKPQKPATGAAFGSRPAQAQVTQAQPAAQAQVTQAQPQRQEVPTVVAAAPDDMQAAIDELLNA